MLYQKSKAKDIIADKDRIRKIVQDTIQLMATTVGSTLGPGGHPVLIEREGLAPLMTKDGVTVAKALGVGDSAANIIVDAAKEICINTAREAGDGTTTAIILANALVVAGQEFLTSNPKHNPQRLVRELQNAYQTVVVPVLQDLSIPTTTENELQSVATISANGDSEIARAVVKAVIEAGDDGTVLINEGQGKIIEVNTTEGYVVTTGLKDLGQIGPAFINDNAGQQVKMDTGCMVLYDGTLNDLKVPGLIQDVLTDGTGMSDGTPIIVMAHDFSDTVKEKFAKTTKAGLTIVPVKTPRSGLPQGASLFLRDMAAYTGAKVYDPGNVHDMDEDGIGGFDSARINMYETFIITVPDPDAIQGRIVELKAIGESAFSELDRSFIRAAIAKLTGGVSTIMVGGSSDLEIRERKARVEDAVEAVRSAIAEGIITGGCSVHLLLADKVRKHPDRKPSWDILAVALAAPFKHLLENCGEDVNDIWPTIQSQFDDSNTLPKTVFDAEEHVFVDPIEAGIIEPTKVCRVAIANALSVATLLITLGGIVVVPRDVSMEQQMELADRAFKSMMQEAGQ